MFASAIREEVFSQKDIVKIISDNFIPIAVQLPRPLRGNDIESRLFQSIYKKKWARQGLCVTNTKGKVIRWLPLWKNKEQFIQLLKNDQERFAEDPDTPGDIRIPGGHSFCPLDPKLPQGMMVADFFGRAINENGEALENANAHENYVQESFGISKKIQQALVDRLQKSKPKSMVKLPQEFSKLIMKYAYLGHLGLRPFENPRKARSTIKRCEFRGKRTGDNVFFIVGKTDVEAKGNADVRGARFRSHVVLSWQGVLKIANNRVVRLLLKAKGTSHISWRGYKESSENVTRLPGGRTVVSDTKVKFGILAPGTGRIKDLQTDASALHQKIKRFHKLAQEWRSKGKDLRPIARLMQRFESLMRQQNFQKAEAILDQALRLLKNE